MARIGDQRGVEPGHGVRRGGFVQHVVRFDDEQFGRIRAFAVREGTSLSEAVRVLVEWGLETIDD
jgi:hypothetical protein